MDNWVSVPTRGSDLFFTVMLGEPVNTLPENNATNMKSFGFSLQYCQSANVRFSRDCSCFCVSDCLYADPVPQSVHRLFQGGSKFSLSC